MRTDCVLNIDSSDTDAQGRYLFYFLTPQGIRQMGRSEKHGSRIFLIQGSPRAVGGWREFRETFTVDGIESARYLCWYYNLLQQLYANGVTTDGVQEILDSEPESYLPRDFWEATGRPANPAFIFRNDRFDSMLGAHVKLTGSRIEWRLESGRVEIFNRIAALAGAYPKLFDNTAKDFVMGWMWKDRTGSPWKIWNKLFGVRRVWWVYGYSPQDKSVSCLHYNNPCDIDSNIFIPGLRHQVSCNSLTPDAWKAKKKKSVLNPVTAAKRRKKNKTTWSS